jgi:ComEC/Rec2-related protein
LEVANYSHPAGGRTDLNSQEERQQFLYGDTAIGTRPTVDDILLPVYSSRRDLAVLDGESPLEHASFVSRLKVGFARCVVEEVAYGHGFLFGPIFLMGGAAIWFSLAVSPPTWLLLALFTVIGSLVIITQDQRDLNAACLKASACIVVGMLLSDWQTRRASTTMLDTAVTTTITGTVERRELDARGYWRYIIAVTNTDEPKLSRPPEKVSVLSRSRHEAVPIGGVITGKARLSPPSGPALPGLNDFAFASYFNGIGATGFFYGAPKTLPSPAVQANGSLMAQADDWLYGLRSTIAQRIRSVIGGDAGAFAASIVTDERRAISLETMEALRVSGLAHIVAISGLNMALAAGIFFVGMRMVFSLFPGFSQRWPVKKIAAFAALLMTLAYYLISGFAVSAERAWLMMSIMLIAVLVDRPSLSLRNVALSAIVIISFSPSEVMGPSFQMSFAATIALVSAYGFWSRRRAEREKLFIAKPPIWLSLASKTVTVIGGVVVTSLIGGISTAAYSVEHFHRITTYGLAANLAAMPVMSLVVMPFGLIGMLLMPFGLDAPFLKVMGYGMAATIDIAKTVASWGGDAGIGRQHGWFLSIMSIGLLLLSLLRTRLALAGILFIVVGLGIMVAERWQARPDLLIYEDGGLVALLGDDAVATTKARPSGFVYDQWERALLLPQNHVAPVMLEDAKSPVGDDADAGPEEVSTSRRRTVSDDEKSKDRERMRLAMLRAGSFTCRKDMWCVAKAKTGASVAVVLDSAFAGIACDVADIVVTTRFVPFQKCRSGAVLLRRDTLRRTGSLEIWLGKGRDAPVQRMRAAMEGGTRPWTEHRSYNWRDKSFDPTLPEHVRILLSATH